MFGSRVLETAIGLVVVYLVFSMFCSTINEWIARFLALRATGLRRGVNELLADGKESGIATLFHAHPLIDTLKPDDAPVLRRFFKRTHAQYPSYIPPDTFALAVMSLTMTVTPASADQQARAVLTTTDPTALGVLKPLLSDVEGDAVAVRQRLAQWFDNSMERVSGWYKRRAQVILFIIALIIAGGWNVDTIAIAKRLLAEPAVREALVKQADDMAATSRATPIDSGARRQAAARVDSLVSAGLDFGWTRACPPLRDGGDCPTPWRNILGIFLTVLALSLGAPFWFDALNNLVNLRQTGAPPTLKPPSIAE